MKIKLNRNKIQTRKLTNLFRTILFSWYSLVGALFYCFLLDMLVVSSQLTIRSYIFVMILCSLAGFPWVLLEFNVDWYLAAHKATWWIMFSTRLRVPKACPTKVISNQRAS